MTGSYSHSGSSHSGVRLDDAVKPVKHVHTSTPTVNASSRYSVCVCACVCVCVCACMCACMCACVCACVCVHFCYVVMITSSVACCLSSGAMPTGSIPLTGDRKADADILAFYKARQKLIERGTPCVILCLSPVCVCVCVCVLETGMLCKRKSLSSLLMQD